MYRSRETVEEWKRDRDPIKRMRERLIASGHMKEAELDKIEAEAKASGRSSGGVCNKQSGTRYCRCSEGCLYEEAETR